MRKPFGICTHCIFRCVCLYVCFTDCLILNSIFPHYNINILRAKSTAAFIAATLSIQEMSLSNILNREWIFAELNIPYFTSKAILDAFTESVCVCFLGFFCVVVFFLLCFVSVTWHSTALLKHCFDRFPGDLRKFQILKLQAAARDTVFLTTWGYWFTGHSLGKKNVTYYLVYVFWNCIDVNSMSRTWNKDHEVKGFPALPWHGPYALSKAAALINIGHQVERTQEGQSNSPECSFFDDFAVLNKKRKKSTFKLFYCNSIFNCKLNNKMKARQEFKNSYLVPHVFLSFPVLKHYYCYYDDSNFICPTLIVKHRETYKC